jgi:hypothetical protein
MLLYQVFAAHHEQRQEADTARAHGDAQLIVGCAAAAAREK